MRRSLLIVMGVWLFACADSDLFGREGEPRVSNDLGGMGGSPSSPSAAEEAHGHKEKGKDEGGSGGAPASDSTVSASVASSTSSGGEREPPHDDDG